MQTSPKQSLSRVARWFPSAWLAETIYTVILRPKPLRAVTNFILLKLTPKKMRVGEFYFIANPADPVMPAAVFLGVYEPYELALFRTCCKPGETVLDIGANVGLYTGTAASLVGQRGLVIALEPVPESFSYLQQMISANSFQQIKAFNVAAGNETGSLNLYVNPQNQGDARTFESDSGRKKVSVKMRTVDDLLAEQGVRKVDLIKIDVQGAEGLVWRGMRKTLAENPNVTVFLEFWPWGLERAGICARDFLNEVAEAGFRASIIDEARQQTVSVGDVRGLVELLKPTEFTTIGLQRSHVNLILHR